MATKLFDEIGAKSTSLVDKCALAEFPLCQIQKNHSRHLCPHCFLQKLCEVGKRQELKQYKKILELRTQVEQGVDVTEVTHGLVSGRTQAWEGAGSGYNRSDTWFGFMSHSSPTSAETAR